MDYAKEYDRMVEQSNKQQEVLRELAKYFTSGNAVPVERATILAKDFWRITGLTHNVKLRGRPLLACPSRMPG